MADPTGMLYSQVKPPQEGEIRAPTWRDTLSNLPATLLGVDYTTDDPRTILLKTLMAAGGGLAALPGTPAAMRGAPLTKVMQGGKPQRVYHGTPRVFEEFDPTKAFPDSLYGPGAYFTNDPGVASGYAGKRALSTPFIFESQQAALRHAQTIGAPFVTQSKGRWFVDPPVAPNVRPAYLDITKPLDIDARVSQDTLKRIAVYAKRRQGYSMIDNLTPDNSGGVSGDQVYKALTHDLGGNEAASRALQELGFDGITHIGGKISGGKPHRVWIAFKPQQVVNPFQYDAQIRGVPGILPPP